METFSECCKDKLTFHYDQVTAQLNQYVGIVSKIHVLIAGCTIFTIALFFILYRRFRKLPQSTAPDKNKTLPKPKLKKDTELNKKESISSNEESSAWKKLTGVGAGSKSDRVAKDSVSSPKFAGSHENTKNTSFKLNGDTSSGIRPRSPAEPAKQTQLNTAAASPSSKDYQKQRTTSPVPVKKEDKPTAAVKRIQRVERDEEKEARDFERELREAEKEAVEQAKSSMRPIHLNIDQNPRSKDDADRSKERELSLLKKLCGEVREVAKSANPEEREERRQEMEKVRTARTYFKTVDKYRSESASAAPRMRLRAEEELRDTESRGSSLRLSQFEPGKINKKITSRFENGLDAASDRARPPTKKLITLDQVLIKNSNERDDIAERERELRELKEIRKNWNPPDITLNDNRVTEDPRAVATKSVKLRWNPSASEDRTYKTQSAEIPSKIDLQTFGANNDQKEADNEKKENLEHELNEMRASRATPLNKRWQPGNKPGQQRSKSAHPVGRIQVSDDSWVLERPSSLLLEEERQKRLRELETLKIARSEQAEELEADRPVTRIEEKFIGKLPDRCWVTERPSSQLLEEEKERRLLELESVKRARLEAEAALEEDRPSSRLEDRARIETLRELEAVKNIRREGVSEEEFSVEGLGTGPCGPRHGPGVFEPLRVKSPEATSEQDRHPITSKIVQNIQKPEEPKHQNVFQPSISANKQEESESKFKQMTNIKDQRERARIHEEARKAQELAQLTSKLQETRAQREQEVQTPVNTLYQEEITQRQRELAQLAMCGHPPPPDI